MWVHVVASDNGAAITNASFSLWFYNNGDGWYDVAFSHYGQYFSCSAPGFHTLYANNDSWNAFRCYLARWTPPPPPTYGRCWS